MGLQCTYFNLCFFLYFWLVPVFLQYLMRAPASFDSAPFFPVPIPTLNGDVPHLSMSSFPQTTDRNINHCRRCMQDSEHKTGLYQWDVLVTVKYKDLLTGDPKKPVSTMYPLIFASNDAKNWRVVADANDVAGQGQVSGGKEVSTHISAPLLVANLKNFGCVDTTETSSTDPWFGHFPNKGRALFYKWKLVEHVAMHGSVNLVACVMQGMEGIDKLIHRYTRDCMGNGGGEMKCHLTPTEALSDCFALGSACGQACNIFSPRSSVCQDNGMLDPELFQGLTHRRVKIKTSPGGGGAAQSLVKCAKAPCKTGLHFNNMYVEAANPLEFPTGEMTLQQKTEQGSFFVLVLTLSNYHLPVHTFTVPKAKIKHHGMAGEADTSPHHHHVSHIGHHKLKHHIRDDDKRVGDDGEKDEDTEQGADNEKDEDEEDEPEEETRTCVDLPGVRLGQIEHAGLKSYLRDDSIRNGFDCSSMCGQLPKCKQSIFSSIIKGCYLFKIATVMVNDFSEAYNSSYCGPSSDKELLMTMLHQAYKGYVAPAPPDDTPAAGPAAVAPPPLRRLARKDEKFYWQIAHVPNLTAGNLRDTGSATVRVVPRNASCFTTPGFVYMVACMTAKPVYMSGKTYNLAPPPFNDRCLAVGGLCGSSCGSSTQATDDAAKKCVGTVSTRRLDEASPYLEREIPRDMLVQRIEPRRSATQRSLAARCFFHLFIFFIAVSYISTLQSKFPGNFTDFYPMHTWDEIRTHGYILEKYGAAVACGCSTGEGKMTVMRNWIGKISSRPQFDDSAFPTFSRWVDIFCDEGHREGARILWTAWTDFLDTNPPINFLEQWATNLQSLSWDQAIERSPFDIRWFDGKVRKVLPVVEGQANKFLKEPGEEVPEGGMELEQDCLVKLQDLAQVFKDLPDNLRMEPSMGVQDDLILSRSVRLGLSEDSEATTRCFTVPYSSNWENQVETEIRDRMTALGLKSVEGYQQSLSVTDANGKTVERNNKRYAAKQHQFPLHFREPLPRKDRQVIMIYCARAKPETDREGIDKTRTLDQYLWACLQPNAVRGSNSKGRQRRPNSESERALTPTENCWASPTGAEVRRCVEGVLERQHLNFLDGLGKDGTSRRGLSTEHHKAYAQEYMKYRTVDSDWEMARFCHGEIMDEIIDEDGDEALILDNPSPSLLKLISELHSGDSSSSPGMGLVKTEVDRQGGRDTKIKHSYAARPSLEFQFANANPSKQFDHAEFKKTLSQLVSGTKQNFDSLTLTEKNRDGCFLVEVSGTGKLIELVRAANPKSIEVGTYSGRMIDNHPNVLVKKHLCMPFCGVRGKSGGLNFAVDLLQFREGFIGTGEESDVTPERMLFGIFDARHQPHPDFWRHCLPKFMNNTDFGYTYEVNENVCMVQAPQTFGSVSVEEDILDVLNGMTFNIMNVIRNRCGGVTSCGTNAIWQINAREFSRGQDKEITREYFDSRTKIEDTASTHLQFCSGKRSVYVQEKISTGIAKLNSDYLCAMQRWAEGAVQLFWLQLFRDKNCQLLALGLSVLGFLGLLFTSLYGPWTKDLLGFNLFCDSQGVASLFMGMDHPICSSLYGIFGNFLFHTIDKVMFEMAESEYMRLIDFAITWFFCCLVIAGFTVVLSWRGTMPKIVRTVIMMENISYWLTSCSIFFWVSLTLFMIIAMDPPLAFNVTHFMLFILCLNITQHSMLNEYKHLGGCDEGSIWRSQQSYTLAAPLYVIAIIRGSASAWRIIWRRFDASFWTSNEHGSDIIVGVTLWVTFIWAAFILCLAFTLGQTARQWIFNEARDNISKQCQIGAVCLLGCLAITVWEPFLALWQINKSVDAMSKDTSGKPFLRWICSLIVWWRSRAWIMRYVVDFGFPALVLSGALGGGVSLITLATYASTVHGFRA